MKKGLRSFLKVLVVISCCWFPTHSFAQGSGDPPNGVDMNAKAQANAAVNNNSYGAVQLPNVTPILGTPGPIPGFSNINPGEMVIYSNALFTSLTMDQIRSMAQKHGKRGKIRVSVEVVNRNAVPKNDDPVKFLKFLPEPGHVVGISYGESIGPNEVGNLATAILQLKEQAYPRYVLILVTRGIAGTTKASTLGITGVASGAPGGSGLGVAPGYLRGTSVTQAIDTYTFRVIGFDFDKEPIEPAPPAPPPPPPPPPPPAPEEAKPQPQAQAPPPTSQPKVEKLEEQAPTPKETCEEPPFVVYFDFDRSEIKKEYRPKIEEISKWLASHRSCRLQLEGHTDKIGTFAYNAALGRKRAEAVYNAVLAYDGTLKDQVIQFVSASKDRPASEYRKENRRVILRVVGPASSK